jgi:hypothetical protein
MELNWRRGFRTINGKVVEVEEALITRQEYNEFPHPPAVPWSLNEFEQYAKVHQLSTPMECALLGYREIVRRLNLRLGELIDLNQRLEQRVIDFEASVHEMLLIREPDRASIGHDEQTSGSGDHQPTVRP